MTLYTQNITSAINKLNQCNIGTFIHTDNSFRYFISELKVNSFRHIKDLDIIFEHPVTIISGNNKVGKTSLLLLLACSHENFIKIDSTSPIPTVRPHGWKDVMSFTSHENVDVDYSYELKWRKGLKENSGEGKRLASSKAWSGLGKKSSDPRRVNAKIRDRFVRLIDLERVLPGRSFTRALYKKANLANETRLDPELEKAFAYIFDLTKVKIYEVGGHINKTCFLITDDGQSYSSYNAASGEESIIYLLKDIIDSPIDSLILIDEVEAGFHPSVQRKLADIIQYISWKDKKQFVITTHSPTMLSAFPPTSRRFIEQTNSGFRSIRGISKQAAKSKMDSIGYPLVRLYCEDSLAYFLVSQALIRMSQNHPYAHRLFNIVKSGPSDQVKTDYERHKRNYEQYSNKIGYCAVFDGDFKENPDFSGYFENPEEKAIFIYPYEAPEKFLVRSYLRSNSQNELRAALEHSDHHSLFQAMVNYGISSDPSDARNRCYDCFKDTPEFTKHDNDLIEFLLVVLKHFSIMAD
jgi:predicted ATPase